MPGKLTTAQIIRAVRQSQSAKCYYKNPGTCKGRCWTCRTCREKFCQSHWHETDKGRNVECALCEISRKKRFEDKPEFTVRFRKVIEGEMTIVADTKEKALAIAQKYANLDDSVDINDIDWEDEITIEVAGTEK